MPIPPGLIVFDLDGTLLIKGQLPHAAAKALQAYTDAGGLWTIATGRAEGRINITGLPVPPLPAIVAHGARTVHASTGHCYRRHPLDPKLILTPLTHAIPEAVIAADDAETIFVGPGYPIPTAPGRRIVELNNIHDVGGRDVDMIRIHAPEATPRLRTALADIPQVRICDVDRANYAEIVTATATKSVAVTDLAKELPLPMSEVWAVGDGDNDTDLLSAAGVGIAMRNATPAATAAADACTLYAVTDIGAAALLHPWIGPTTTTEPFKTAPSTPGPAL